MHINEQMENPKYHRKSISNFPEGFLDILVTAPIDLKQMYNALITLLIFILCRMAQSADVARCLVSKGVNVIW